MPDAEIFLRDAHFWDARDPIRRLDAFRDEGSFHDFAIVAFFLGGLTWGFRLASFVS